MKRASKPKVLSSKLEVTYMLEESCIILTHDYGVEGSSIFVKVEDDREPIAGFHSIEELEDIIKDFKQKVIGAKLKNE
jgi:hypothetical protein